VLSTSTWGEVVSAFRAWQEALGAGGLEIDLFEGQNPERYLMPFAGSSSVVPTYDTNKWAGETRKVSPGHFLVWIDSTFIADVAVGVKWASVTHVIVHEILEAVIGLQLATVTDNLKEAVLDHFARALRRLSGEEVPVVTASG